MFFHISYVTGGQILESLYVLKGSEKQAFQEQLSRQYSI